MTPSPSFERILVGVDSEGLAVHAVARAAWLARRLNARFELIHAVELPPRLTLSVGEDTTAAIEAEALSAGWSRTVERLAPALREAGVEDDVGDHLTVLPGHGAKVVLERAETSGADLIVLGAHGKRSLFGFGSTTRAVLAGTPCPVWKQPVEAGPVDRIVAAVDFSEHSREALASAHSLAAKLGASMRVIHVFALATIRSASIAGAVPAHSSLLDRERAAASEILEEWTGALGPGAVQVESAVVEGDPTERILAEAERADLTVLGTHGRTGLARFLLGSVAHSVLQKAQGPVLVIPSAERTWLLGSPPAASEPGRRT